jgi:prepilin-type N-terminal cleavage/methylation domain-containing protein
VISSEYEVRIFGVIMINMKVRNTGFTLIELMITVLIVTVAAVAISGVIAGSHLQYAQMFKRVHGDVANDSYNSRLIFDRICRKAKASSAVINSSVPSLRVDYYSNPNVNGSAYLIPDKFAIFYLGGTNLMLDTGNVGSSADTSTVIARNVTELEFSAPNIKSAQMVMTLKNNDHSITITCGSVMHN